MNSEQAYILRGVYVNRLFIFAFVIHLTMVYDLPKQIAFVCVGLSLLYVYWWIKYLMIGESIEDIKFEILRQFNEKMDQFYS